MSLNTELIKNILNGRYENVPDLTKKVVRIFLSSTFTDTNSERDYLIEKVYPRLKEYFKQKYDLDFQTVDMRWGIPNDAYEYHGTTELCLNEIINCRKFSIGANFVTLIGQKYGLRPLPRRVDADEFEILKDQIFNVLKEDLTIKFEFESHRQATDVEANSKIVYELANIVDDCYKLDTNPQPKKYRLLPISKIIPDYVCSDQNRQEAAAKFWDAIHLRLSKLLRLGADSALANNLINSVKRDRYFVSITEKEIFEGIHKAQNPNQSALCFIRDIENMHEHLGDSNASRFIDIRIDEEKKPVIDEEAMSLLNHLKDEKIPSKLNRKTNVFNFKIKWKDNGLDKQRLPRYLQEFGETFFREIVRLVEEGIQRELLNDRVEEEACMQICNPSLYFRKFSSGEFDDKIDEFRSSLFKEFKELSIEIGLHANSYNEITSKFFGRDYLMEQIKKYSSSDSQLPFVVTGESGSGKTSILALVNKMLPSWMKNTPISIISRFLGTTIHSSSIYKTYRSLALQLHFLMNSVSPKNSRYRYERFLRESRDLNGLCEFILSELKEFYELEPGRKIFLLLDSLDQLTPNDYKTVSSWIFVNLPPNTKLIVSTIPQHGNLLDMIKMLIVKRHQSIQASSPTVSEDILKHQVLFVEPLNPQQCETILGNWLIKANQSLTEQQWDCLKTIFKKGVLFPLFLKLIYDFVIKWRSYEEPDSEFREFVKIDDIIMYLFRKLEKTHGTVIFRRAISYMTVCRNGISDTEMEDILSLDDDVLFSVFQFHLPPIRRLPTILWVRIKNDLTEYIVEKEANDTKVVFWYHRRFVEVALDSYFKAFDQKETNTVFQNILDFYNETWKGRQKPFALNDYLKKKLKKVADDNQADRFLTSQPIEFTTPDGVVHYNKRKLAELPNCIASLTSAVSIKMACDLLFYSYQFMHAKFKCDALNDIQEDLRKILENRKSWKFSDDEKLDGYLLFFERIILLCGYVLAEYPDSFAFQFTSRLLEYYGKKIYFTKLIDECDRLSIQHCAFVSPHFQLELPGSYLQTSFQKHNEPIKRLIISSQFFYTYSANKIAVYSAFDPKTNSCILELALPRRDYLKTLRLNSKREADPLFDVNIDADLDFTSRDSYSVNTTVKLIYVPKLFQALKTAELTSDKNFNPDLLPVHFLVIRKYYTFVITADRQIKFFYECDKFDEDRRILDVFSMGKQMIVVEKGSSSIKVFQNYETDPKKYNEMNVCDQVQSTRIKDVISKESVNIQGHYSNYLELFLRLSNDELHTIFFQVSNSELRKANRMYSVYVSSDESFGEESFENDNSTDGGYQPRRVRYLGGKPPRYDSVPKPILRSLNPGLSYQLLHLFKPCGLDVTNFICRNRDDMIALFTESSPRDLITSHLYLTSSDRTFVILHLHKNNYLKAHIFENFTREPVINVKDVMNTGDSNQKLMTGALVTERFVYIVHPSKHQKGALCRLELKEPNLDDIFVAHKNYFVYARNGLIEMNRIVCTKNSHTIKNLARFHSNSAKITNLICLEGIILCTTIEGSYNFYHVVAGKSSKDVYPSFDRTQGPIFKLYPSVSDVFTLSDHNELCLWSLNTGKKILILDTGASKNDKIKIFKAFMYRDLNAIILYDKNGVVFFYRDNQLLSKLKLNVASRSGATKLVFMNDMLEWRKNPKSKDKRLKVLDLYGMKIFDLMLKNGPKQSQLEKEEFEIDKPFCDYKDKSGPFIVLWSLGVVLEIDAHLRTFSGYTFAPKRSDGRPSNLKTCSIKDRQIRFANFKDERTLTKFFNLYGAAKNFKYKILSMDDNKVCFAVTSQRQDPLKQDRYLNHSTLLVDALIISSIVDESKNVEIEITSLKPFCKSFYFTRASRPTQHVSHFAFNYRVELDSRLCLDHNYFLLTENNAQIMSDNQIIIENKTTNAVVLDIDLNAFRNNFNVVDLCFDAKVEYLVFTDDQKLIWLFRISNSAKIACLPLLSIPLQIRFSQNGEYVCMSTTDRRMFCLLVVDPTVPAHKDRIAALESRKVKPKKDDSEDSKDALFDIVAEDKDIFSSDNDSIDSSEVNSKSSGAESDTSSSKNPATKKPAAAPKKLKKQQKSVQIEESSSDDDDRDAHITDDQKVQRIPKTPPVRPITLKIPLEETRYTNWLKNRLEQYKIEQRNKASKKADDNGIFQLTLKLTEDANSSVDQAKAKEKFVNELKTIIKTNSQDMELNMYNTGKQAKVTNITSKACIVS